MTRLIVALDRFVRLVMGTPRPQEHYATDQYALVPVKGAAYLYKCPVCTLWVRRTHHDAMTFALEVTDHEHRICSRCTSTLDRLDRQLVKGARA